MIPNAVIVANSFHLRLGIIALAEFFDTVYLFLDERAASCGIVFIMIQIAFKKRETQHADLQTVAANRNLERDFFQKVNAFFQKVNAFFQKVNAIFFIGVLPTRMMTHHKYMIGVCVGLYLRSFGEAGGAWYGRVSRIFAATHGFQTRGT